MHNHKNSSPPEVNELFRVKDEYISLWLGRRDSNPRMPGPKPGALPLGDGPS